MNECHTLCNSLNNIIFEGAPKRKLSANINLEYMKFAYMTATANELVYLVNLMKDTSCTQEEILGELQIRLTEAWNKLATSRLGYTAFSRTSLEEILKAKDPEDFLRKTAIVRSKK